MNPAAFTSDLTMRAPSMCTLPYTERLPQKVNRKLNEAFAGAPK